MKILFRSAAQVLVALSLMLSSAHATVIDFTSTSLGGNRWRTDYVINNDTLPGPLDEFTIYFDEHLFA
ncbi:MAG: hypothetical protein K2X55_06135, partial [Burkholderiaceae bacterium]|nr:hypothetical protein [Burkholderiaceae bacterium]